MQQGNPENCGADRSDEYAWCDRPLVASFRSNQLLPVLGLRESGWRGERFNRGLLKQYCRKLCTAECGRFTPPI